MIHRQRNKIFIGFWIVWLCTVGAAFATDYRHLEWRELQTEADQIAMQHLPRINHRQSPDMMPDPLANLSGDMDTTIKQSLDRQQATAVLHSTTVRAELNNTRVQLEGFIVPVEANGSGAITEFFLVPYIGACIHVPPPPPNQMVYVQYPSGINADLINEPIRVEGILHTVVTDKSLAQAAYSMKADRASQYKEGP